MRSTRRMKRARRSSATSPVRNQPSSVIFSSSLESSRSSRAVTHGPRTCSSPPDSSSMRKSTSGSDPALRGAQRVALVVVLGRVDGHPADRAPAGWSRSCPRPGRCGTPKRSSKPRISASGTAEPPQMTSRSDGQVGRRVEAQHALPDRRHAGGRSSPSRPRSARPGRRGVIRGPGSTCRAPAIVAAYGRPQALTWNIGTTGITESSSRTPSAVGLADAERVQHGRAVRVERRPSAGRWCRSCSTWPRPCSRRGRGTRSPRRRPRRAARSRARRRAAPSASGIRTSCSTPSKRGMTSASEASRKIDLVLGVADDVAQVVLEQADVDRVQHRAHATARRGTARGGAASSSRRWRRGRPGRCRGRCSDEASRRARRTDLAVGRALDVVVRAADDLAVGEEPLGALGDVADQQGAIHHQAVHGATLPRPRGPRARDRWGRTGAAARARRP